MNSESPEQLLDAFKAAALSVTKLYKTSAAAQAKARADGYQDCLDDILSFLDKESIGLSDGDGWTIRKWATERLEGRDTATMDSDEEVDKSDAMSSPELHRSTTVRQASPAPIPNEAPLRGSAPPTVPVVEQVMEPMVEEQPSQQHQQQQQQQPRQQQPSRQQQHPPEPSFVVPSQDTFNFHLPSPYPYPPEGCLNIANLDLSDTHTTSNSTPASITRTARTRQGNPQRSGTRSGGNHLGRGAGQKRRLNLNLGEIFDLGSLGYGKDYPFGNGGGKRQRHT
ncbi:hypothetical protein DL546_004829 [Coniochaeta pulveracea]|uniref:Uncharacterized protein n=1 Tax=Coniochaeta pulveracea TaxID=177199 RepID=A0A420YNC2_9PEZI|nr:hypothetical protein DL546_004829 [Coniochaeta pulveracea]